MNAETRAKAVMDSLEPVLEPLSFYAFNKLEELMSAAITQAENEKLEEAARVAENPGFIQARDTEWDMGVNYAKPFIANAIRSLKSKD